MEINREIKNITSAFVLEDNLTECIPYGSGHINDTYRLTYDTGKHYILQKMNRSIFTKPVELMENVSGVTAWLKKKIQENGGDVERETLNLVMTKDGLPYYVDEDGEYWRVYLFIENATCYDMVKDEEDFYQSAVAFGHFQRLLADYPAETLHETIVNFHNTVDRLDSLKLLWKKIYVTEQQMWKKRFSLCWTAQNWHMSCAICRIRESCRCVLHIMIPS